MVGVMPKCSIMTTHGVMVYGVWCMVYGVMTHGVWLVYGMCHETLVGVTSHGGSYVTWSSRTCKCAAM